MPIFAVSAVTAGGLAPADARPSAGTKMTKFAFVYIDPGSWRIKMDVLV